MGRILVIGGSGQLGTALVARLERLGLDCAAPSRAELGAGAAADVERLLACHAPAAVLNAAAYTDVAAAERPENRAEVFRANLDLPRWLAVHCERRSVPFVHVSTDYVFDGTSDRPYREDDRTHPLQVYGASKLAGEQAVQAAHPDGLIVRTSTLFGPAPRTRPHYVDAILAKARGETLLAVVEGPVASPTFAPDLATAILSLLEAAARGVVHVVNAGSCSRLELARAVVRAAGLDGRVQVVAREATPDGLERPAYSVLDSARFATLAGAALRPWQDAVDEYVQQARR